MTRVPVVVVGGGITGLAAALRVHERLGAGSMLLIEAEGRFGGKIATERRGGAVIEGGPDCFLAAKPGGMDLCRRLGLAERLQGTNPDTRRTYVSRRGRLYELPAGLTGFVPTRLGPLLGTRLLSLAGRLRAGLEPLIPRGTDPDPSVAAFVSRRFGREAWDWLVEPLLAGIYAGDGRALSLRATFPQLLADERAHGSVLRAMLRRPRPASPRSSGFVTLPGGLADLVDAIRGRLPADACRARTVVTRLDRHDGTYRLHLASGAAVEAAAVILATPAWASASLLAGVAPALAAELGAIEYASTATVSLVYDRSDVPRPLDGHGYVSPRAEGGAVVACTWTSNKFPGRVPAGRVLVRFFLGRAGREDIGARDEDSLIAIARTELGRRFGVRGGPLVARVFRWPRAMPQYAVGHLARLDRIDRALERLPGLALAGAGYRGVGIPDCIVQGEAAVERVLPHAARAAA